MCYSGFHLDLCFTNVPQNQRQCLRLLAGLERGGSSVMGNAMLSVETCAWKPQYNETREIIFPSIMMGECANRLLTPSIEESFNMKIP